MPRPLVFAAVLALLACNPQPAGSLTPTSAPYLARAPRGPGSAGPETPVPPASWLRLEPADATGVASASAVALARLGDRTLAFVADADDDAVITFDVDARWPLASTPIGARPSAVLVTKTGRVVVLGADDARVHVLAMSRIDGPLVAQRVVAVPEEPVSAALASDGNALLVASRWGHALSVVPLTGDEPPFVIDLPRDPAAVVTSADGRRAFVLHAVGSRASIVDLAARSARTVSLDRKTKAVRSPFPEMSEAALPFDAAFGDLDAKGPPPKSRRVAPPVASQSLTLHADQAFAVVRTKDGIVAPVASVDPGAEESSSGYGASEAAAVPAIVSFDDGGEGRPATRRVFGSRCLLPRGAAVDASGGRLLVACLGSDEVAVLRAGPRGIEKLPAVSVPRGPVAVSVDERGRRAVVWSAFDRVISVLTIDGAPRVVARISPPRTTPAPQDSVLRGRVLFNAAFDARVASDGRACASCHPDARDDGLAWSSPGGRRQTPMLVERLEGTAPYGWDGDAEDFEHHLHHTTARLGGRGLDERDAADLQAYIATLHVPAPSRAVDDALVARGAVLFHADETGCASCHAGTALTDGDTHDVGSPAHTGPGRAFDTPSLHLIAHSAPYFHDGRYDTLSGLLTATDAAMGHTSQLSPDDRKALEAYVTTL
jgi:DNA-binding beta-propeller fold protein YncE